MLKRWFIEPKPNVFVGTVNRRTRDKVLDYVQRNAAGMSLLIITSEPNCQGFKIQRWGDPRAVVWLVDFRWRSFEEAQGGVGFGAVVVEAGIETLEGFFVMKPQDGSPQQGKHLASAGFLARTRGVFLPQAGVTFPVVFVLHRPVAADGLGEPGGASFLPQEVGDEVTGLAFEFIAIVLDPFARDLDQLACAGKGTDVLIQIDPAEVAAFDASVFFFPAAHPFVGDGGEFALRELVEGGLVILQAQQVVAAVADDYECRFFWVLRASPVTRAP